MLGGLIIHLKDNEAVWTKYDGSDKYVAEQLNAFSWLTDSVPDQKVWYYDQDLGCFITKTVEEMGPLDE
jgi:hypothetical protein